MIISGFPCIGKSTLANIDKKIIDLESSIFKIDFNSYVKMIIFFHTKKYIVLCSSHREVRQELKNKGIDYVYVKPCKDDKEIYKQRSKERQPHPLDTSVFMKNWETWLEPLPNENIKILPKGGYINFKTIEEIQKGIFEQYAGEIIDFIENIIIVDLSFEEPFPSPELIINNYPHTLIIGRTKTKEEFFLYSAKDKQWKSLKNKSEAIKQCKYCKYNQKTPFHSVFICKLQDKGKFSTTICDCFIPKDENNKINFECTILDKSNKGDANE